jgi:hypothetical protein
MAGKIPIPKIEVSKLNEKQSKSYRIADNKLNESDWDKDILIDELRLMEAKMFFNK